MEYDDKKERAPLLGSEHLSAYEEAWIDADHFILQFVPMCSEDRRSACFSPVYYFVLTGLALTGYLGSRVHAIFGQSGKVNLDETEEEYEARTQWVYQLTGAFTFATLLQMLALVYCLVTNCGRLPEFGMAIAVYWAYILGNFLFLRGMSQKNRLHTRLAIVANAGFAAGMVSAIVYSIFILSHNKAHHLYIQIIIWIFRSFIVLLFIAQTAVYGKLWSLYPSVTEVQEESQDEHYCNGYIIEIFHDFLVLVAALAVWSLFLFAILSINGGYHFIWYVFG